MDILLNLINTEYRSSKDGRILSHKMKADGVYSILIERFPYCKKTSDFIMCLEMYPDEPKCSFCGVHCPPTQKTCSRSCGASGKPAWNKGIKSKIAPWNKGIKGYKGTPCTEETKEKIRLTKIGEKNPMFGTKKTKKEKENLSNIMKNKIKCGEFTPNGGNRYTHFESSYNGIKFRSSWEAAFYSTNTEMKYEKIRIPYYDTKKSIDRIYITDFVDEKKRIIYEVKPSNLLKNCKDKLQGASKWCKDNDYKFKCITELQLIKMKEYIDFSGLDEKTIIKLERMNERYCSRSC